MWMSADKRRLFARETADMPFLRGASKDDAASATQSRLDILEILFDHYIKPDDSRINVTSSSEWKRARQLWKPLTTEPRAWYFIELATSRYREWIETGEAWVLPCTSDEVERLNAGLPPIVGSKSDVEAAREVRATFMKFILDGERRVALGKASPAERQKLEKLTADVKKTEDAGWFIVSRQKDFSRYEKMFRDSGAR